MSYAIFTVYYGVPVSPDQRADMGRLLLQTDPDADSDLDPDNDDEMSSYLNEVLDGLPGVHVEYSGSADDTPMAFGIELDSFDECEHDFDVASLTLEATDEIKKQYDTLFGALPVEVQTAFKQYLGDPRAFVLVSTS